MHGDSLVFNGVDAVVAAAGGAGAGDGAGGCDDDGHNGMIVVF